MSACCVTHEAIMNISRMTDETLCFEFLEPFSGENNRSRPCRHPHGRSNHALS